MSVYNSREQKDIKDYAGSLFYCFTFKLASGQLINLTNYAEKVISNQHGETVFLPYGHLNVKRMYFDDANQNEVNLTGVFDYQAICKDNIANLEDVKIFIYLADKKSIIPLVDYCCYSYEDYGHHFSLLLKPISCRYNQSLLNSYSKSCRAKFGDSKCGIDINKYSKTYIVNRIEGNKIYVHSSVKEDINFFDNGVVKLMENEFQITSCGIDYLEIDSFPKGDELAGKTILVQPGCDKSILSCCKKYSNAINFRGEPFVPLNNYFKRYG